MALGLFTNGMLSQYLQAGIKRGGGGGSLPIGDARFEGGPGGPPQKDDPPGETSFGQRPDNRVGEAPGGPAQQQVSSQMEPGRAVRPTETGGFDAGYAQNLASFAGQNLARPNTGVLSINPFAKSAEGMFPGAQPTTMLENTLQQTGYQDLSTWGENTSTPTQPGILNKYSGKSWFGRYGAPMVRAAGGRV